MPAVITVSDFEELGLKITVALSVKNNVIYKTQEPMGAFLDEIVWTQSLWSDCMPDGRIV
jgi:hypothetical protein